MTVGDPRKRSERPDRKGPLGDPVAFAFLNEVGIIEQLARNRFEAVMPDDLLLSHFTVLNHLVRLGDGRSPSRPSPAPYQTSTKGSDRPKHRRPGWRPRGLVRGSNTDPPEDRRGQADLPDGGGDAAARGGLHCRPLVAELRRSGEGTIGVDALAGALPVLQAVRVKTGPRNRDPFFRRRLTLPPRLADVRGGLIRSPTTSLFLFSASTRRSSPGTGATLARLAEDADFLDPSVLRDLRRCAARRGRGIAQPSATQLFFFVVRRSSGTVKPDLCVRHRPARR